MTIGDRIIMKRSEIEMYNRTITEMIEHNASEDKVAKVQIERDNALNELRKLVNERNINTLERKGTKSLYDEIENENKNTSDCIDIKNKDLDHDPNMDMMLKAVKMPIKVKNMEKKNIYEYKRIKADQYSIYFEKTKYLPYDGVVFFRECKMINIKVPDCLINGRPIKVFLNSLIKKNVRQDITIDYFVYSETFKNARLMDYMEDNCYNDNEHKGKEKLLTLRFTYDEDIINETGCKEK